VIEIKGLWVSVQELLRVGGWAVRAGEGQWIDAFRDDGGVFVGRKAWVSTTVRLAVTTVASFSILWYQNIH
jgi:hypothetical protein